MEQVRTVGRELGRALYGVISLEQLRALGVPDSTVRGRVAAGRFHRLYRGVYSVVPPRLLRIEGRWLAAVLACGRGAALSHRDASELQGHRRGYRRRIDVTVPGRNGRNYAGIDVHRSTTLRPQDVTVIRGIPVTTIPRTQLDLAEVLSRDQLERVLEQSEADGTLDPAALKEQIAHNPTRKGARLLGAIIEEYEAGLGQVWSEFERELRAAIRTLDLPRPLANWRVVLDDGELPICPDLHWPEQRLVVEADSFKWHRSRRAFELNTRNDQRLIVAGWLPVRLSYRQLRDERERLIRMIVQLVRERTPD